MFIMLNQLSVIIFILIYSVYGLNPTTNSLGSYDEPKEGCDYLNRTTFLRSEGMRIQEIPRNTIRAVSLNQCAKHCSMKSGAVDCRSFEYNAASQSCALQSTQGQPFGPAIVVNTNEPGIAFFQQICIASEELCAAPYSFERYPQHILTGEALQKLSTDGLSECLSLCLESRRKLKMDCKSVMYYYETGECILNRQTKKEFPHLFTNDTKFQLVDYFENNCYDVACYGNSDIHWIRSEDFNIGIEKDVIMSGLTSDECKQACIENMVGAEMFPCKAYVYSLTKQECHLTAESGLIFNPTTKLLSDDIDNPKNKLNSELSAIGAGQYFEKFCIDGPVRCKEASFEMLGGKMLDSYDKVIPTMSISHCLHMCLIEAENCTSVMFFKDKNECVLNKKSQYSDPELFRPAENVDYYDNICEYEPGTLPLNEKAVPAKNAFSTDDESSSDESIEQALVNFREESLESSFEKRQKPVFQAGEEPSNKIKGTLETECRLDGIIITSKFEKPTSGALFVKDHSSTCRQVFTDAIDSQLVIPYPSSIDSNPDCPGVELSPNLWSFIIVIQKNNIGIPSLMTESDRVFNVTCDYSNTAVTEKQRDANKESEIFVTSKSSEQFLGKIRMSIHRNNEPVTTVSLGEELEIKWNIDNYERSNSTKAAFGYFIDECVAERLDGQPPEPAPLRLIYQGCPDEKVRHRLMRYPIVEVENGFSTKMKAFRFDGSRRVRIRCAVNICVNRCEPVTCESDRELNSVLSFGKKRKKRQTVADLQDLLKKYHDVKMSGNIELNDTNETTDSDGEENDGSMIEQSTISGTYTILENNNEASEAKANDSNKLSLPLEKPLIITPPINPINAETIVHGLNLFNNTSDKDKNDTVTGRNPIKNNNCDLLTKTKPNQICIMKTVFIGLIISVSVLFAVQLFTFINCCYKKFSYSSSYHNYDENSSLTSTTSLTHSGSKDFYTPYFNNIPSISSSSHRRLSSSDINSYHKNEFDDRYNKESRLTRKISKHNNNDIKPSTSSSTSSNRKISIGVSSYKI